jgi:signal transduction histidine kinase
MTRDESREFIPESRPERIAVKLLKSIISGFWPQFLKRQLPAFREMGFVKYTRMWLFSMILLAVVSITPLVVLTIIDFNLTRQTMVTETVLRATRIASNTRRTLSNFLHERLSALFFLTREESFTRMTSSGRLDELLKNLKFGFGGVIDLSVIDQNGEQLAYSGPFDLVGRDYSTQEWFKKTLDQGMYVTDVLMGFRHEPHIIVAVRSKTRQDQAFVLRATLDTEQFIEIISRMEIGYKGSAFLINREGMLQMDSEKYGTILTKVDIPIPEYSERTSHFFVQEPGSEGVLIAYAYIKHSPFILCVAKQMSEVMGTWKQLRLEMLWLVGLALAIILVVIYFVSTFLINAIFEANLRQAKAMEKMEQTGRLASVGRLAAGVAHEINNPLAVILERTGLAKDQLMAGPHAPPKEKIASNLDIVLDAVERCGRITKQLLGFARKVDVKIETLDIRQVVKDVLTFVEKEAEYRGIKIDIQHESPIPLIRTDRLKVQQVLLNIFTNAFQAMPDGGVLAIHIEPTDKLGDGIKLTISDTGSGISEKNLAYIFEPFFTTKAERGGSGLGLAITYGLVKKLQGEIGVESELGKGTTFTIHLPEETKEH